MPDEQRKVFASLLKGKEEFDGFLSLVKAERVSWGLPGLIRRFMRERYVLMPMWRC